MRRHNIYVKYWRPILILIFIVLIMVGAKGARAEERYAYCTDPLNVREEMDIESTWVSQYPENATIVIQEDLGDWCRVEGGYVKAEYLHDSVEIYKTGKTLEYSIIFAEPYFFSGTLGHCDKDSEELFIRKENGFLELQSGGWVMETFVTFDYVAEPMIHESNLTVDDFKEWNMVNLPIRYLGTLNERIKAQGVTRSGGLYFIGDIPIYDIIDGVAYFPAGKSIYKMPLEKFAKYENVGSSYQTIAAYRTTYYNSPSGRQFNIEKVSEILDGTVIKAGKTFSYNKVTGPRDETTGYREATVIVNGEYVPGFGGGVCQPSSTIYAAVMNTELFKVTARKPHGGDGITYLPEGMDATVSYDYVDLKFVNEHTFDVVLNVKSSNEVCLVTITRAE